MGPDACASAGAGDGDISKAPATAPITVRRFGRWSKLKFINPPQPSSDFSSNTSPDCRYLKRAVEHRLSIRARLAGNGLNSWCRVGFGYAYTVWTSSILPIGDDQNVYLVVDVQQADICCVPVPHTVYYLEGHPRNPCLKNAGKERERAAQVRSGGGFSHRRRDLSASQPTFNCAKA